jgi:hypothetical protein
MDYPVADLGLSRRLERAEGAAGARFVEARARLSPSVGARWIEVAGAYAMFDGIDSPITQSFGLGLFDPVGPEQMQALESFFRSLGAAVDHEVSPLIDPATLALLTSRGYRPIEFTTVLFRPIGSPRPAVPRAGAPVSRVMAAGEEALWAEVSAEGWRDVHPELYDFLLALGRINAARGGTVCFFAERDEVPVAAGVLCMHEGIAMLAGACTVARHRQQGAQGSLLAARLAHAAGQGCDLAMMCARPGSASQRNAERHGFRTAYTRVKWRLER